MFSFAFEKGEPPPSIRWEKKSSVLDNKSDWPFDWDWNALFCHDFPLEDLPDTVLREVMGLLDNQDRRELSFTSSKLRTMIVRNKSADMDIRKTVECGEFVLSFPILFTSYRNTKSFTNIPSFMEFTKTLSKYFHYKCIYIRFGSVWNPFFDFSNFVEAFAGTADVVHAYQKDSYDNTPSELMISEMLYAFLKCSHFTRINFGYFSRPPSFNERRTLVKVIEMARSIGMKVRRKRGGDYGISFQKEIDCDGEERLTVFLQDP